MDTRQFLASIIDSLAWPVTIGFVVYLMREEIKRLIPFLRRLRVAGLDAE